MDAVFNRGAAAPCPTPFNMAEYVLAKGAATPDKIALAVLGPSRAERWSFARLSDAIRGTGLGLLQAGFRPGDRVLIRLDNTVDFPIAYLGAISVGILPVPTSAALTTAELDAMAPLLQPVATLAAPGIALPSAPGRLIELDELRDWRDLPPAPFAMGDPNRPAYIVFTSGTGGRTRGVVHAHRAVWARRMMFDGWYGLTAEDRLLHAGAFNWTFTLGTGVIDPITAGATALIPAPGTDRATLALLLKRHDATIFAAAPGVFRQLLATSPTLSLPRLRHALSAGEKLPESLRDAWTAATGTAVHEAYGMSECSTFVSGSPQAPARPGTLGRPQPGRHIALLGDADRPVGIGEEGEIAVNRSDPGLMLGYLGDASPQGDWFRTGDRAMMAEDGSLTYLGRADDMMNAGGFRVSPIEVEAVYAAHPALGAVAAVERQVKTDVRVIALYYEAAEAQDAETLKEFGAARLADYKLPRHFEHVDVLPRAGNGKISRKALKR